MTRNATDKWLGGVLGGIARALGISSGLLRGLFLVFFFHRLCSLIESQVNLCINQIVVAVLTPFSLIIQVSSLVK